MLSWSHVAEEIQEYVLCFPSYLTPCDIVFYHVSHSLMWCIICFIMWHSVLSHYIPIMLRSIPNPPSDGWIKCDVRWHGCTYVSRWGIRRCVCIYLYTYVFNIYMCVCAFTYSWISSYIDSWFLFIYLFIYSCTVYTIVFINSCNYFVYFILFASLSTYLLINSIYLSRFTLYAIYVCMSTSR